MAKLTKCKTCGADMAKSAKVCPSCGAKNPRKKLKKLIIFLVIVGIIVGGTAINMAITSKGAPVVTSANGEKLSLGEFEKTYHNYYLNDDVDGFITEYLPAEVVMSGKIKAIDHSSVGVSDSGSGVHLDANASRVSTFTIKEDQYQYKIYYDLYTKPEEYKFGELKVDDEVTATGYITKETISSKRNGKRYYGEQIYSESDMKVIILGSEDGIVKN